MSPASSNSINASRWLLLAASVIIALHLGAVVVGALAAPSGPWPSIEGGMEMGPPPWFADWLGRLARPYLKAAGLTHSYRFPTNRPALPALSLEIELKDRQGNALKDQQGAELVISIPDKGANPWVRHRQELLARWVGNDMGVTPPMSVAIAAPGQQVPEVSYWDMTQAGELTLVSQPQHLVPRDRPVMGPSPVSLLLVRSYVRHLCHIHGAAKADVLRYHREPIPPMVLMTEADVPAEAFDPIPSHFGEFTE
jgi:hypothetical protein